MLSGVMILRAQEGNTAPRHGSGRERAVQEVLQMKREYDRALLRGDSSWFDRAFADDYLLIVGNGRTYGKTEIVKQLASGDVVWKAAAGRDMKVRTYGDTVVVTGRFTGKWLQKGKPVNVEERFTSVWVKDRGRWKAVSEHASDVSAQ
jgi:ketosteroid isomerase-like protein